MEPIRVERRSTDALKILELRLFLSSVAFFTLASRSLAVVIGFQIYRITHNPLSLGLLGLVEAIPAISLVLFGGYVADHFNRKKILLITRGSSLFCALALAFLSWRDPQAALPGLYGVIFLAGIARGFADPANTAFEAQVVPKHLTVNASSWITSTWITCSIAGPAAIGFIFDAWDASGSYLVIAGCFILSFFCTFLIPSKPLPPQPKKEFFWESIKTGWRFIFANQSLWTALTLDLFAVFFGGAMALLPVFAEDILHVGAKGLGFLNAAPSIGALFITLFATHRPPIARAGRNLLLAVLGFGLSIIVFAFSRNFWLSMGALFFSGVFDGVSMVIRRSMVRLLSPDHLRGRVAAANWIFIVSSNELGAMESGVLASLIGTVPCVAVGGFMTILVVAAVAWFAKELKGLRFNPDTFERL